MNRANVCFSLGVFILVNAAAVPALVTTAAAAPEQRGVLRFDLNAIDQRWREAVGDAQPVLKDLAVNGRKQVEKSLAAYNSCLEKKKQEPGACADKRAGFVGTLGTFIDSALGVVETIEARLDLAPEARFKLGKLLLPAATGQPVQDNTLASLQAVLGSPSAGSAAGSVAQASPELTVQLLEHFARLTNEVVAAPGGFPEVLARQIQRLEMYRIYFLGFRRHLVLYAGADQREHVLEGLRDAVDVLREANGDPLNNLPKLEPRGEADADTLLNSLPSIGSHRR